MTGISDFGYNKSSGKPMARVSDNFWMNWQGVGTDAAVTPVQVVGPGQVAVDAADLRKVLLHPEIRGFEPAARLLSAVAGSYSDAALDELKSRLAATEPTPDSGQGETDPAASGGEPDRAALPDTPYMTISAHTKIGTGTWWSDHKGEWHYPGTGRKVPQDERDLLVSYDILAQPPKAYDEAYEQGWDDGWTFAKKADPAAEPDRVTLPDPTPPIVWSFADEEPWRPEHITFNGAKYVLADDTPAAEPDRVTLPDTPWTTVRVTLEGGRQWVWRTEGEGEPTWRNHGNLRVDKEDLNNVVDFTILAQPPKADPAETGARSLSDLEIAKYADRAAERGRDEALAVVVKALLKVYDWYGDISAPVPVRNLEALARMIERESGGDGHE